MSQFRVLQFNMQFGQTWDPANPDAAPIDLERTIEELRTHEADVIFLQEVEQALPGGLQVQPPANFTRLRVALPEYDACFAYPRPDPRELPFGVGLAIFCRQPLRAVRQIDLPSPPIPFEFRGRTTTPTDRVLLSARTTIGDREVQLLNTHLLAFFMLGATSEDNPEQRRLVGEQLRTADGPTLLAGDFNVRRHESLVRQFGEIGFRSVQTDEVTWRRQPFVLDHIFHNAGLRCLGHRVVPTLASDHHALVAEFALE